MSKVWLNSSGKLLVDSSGRPYLCDHCPCGGGGGDNPPGIYGSKKTLTVNVDVSWTGLLPANGYFQIAVRFIVGDLIKGRHKLTASEKYNSDSDDGTGDCSIGIYASGESGTIRRTITITIIDTKHSENCKDMPDLRFNVIKPVETGGVTVESYTNNSTHSVVCEDITDDEEFK